MRRDNTFYLKYLKSPQWQIKREMYFAAKGKWCKACGKSQGPIQIHHITYDRLGRELLGDLTSLCPPCHNKVGQTQRRGFDLRTATIMVLTKRV